MPTLGWRYLLGISSLPVLLSSILCAWLPESARFHLTNGEHDKAIKILEDVSHANRTALPPGELVAISSTARRSGFRELLCKGQRRHSVILWAIWFTSAFSYYGIVILTTEIFQHGNVCQVASSKPSENQSANVCTMRCMSSEDYKDFFLSSLPEFGAYVLTVVMVDRIGRLKTIFVTLFAFAMFTLSLNVCFDR